MAAEYRLFVCLKDNYGVLLHDPASGACAAIDAPEAAPIEAALAEAGWQVDANTHQDIFEGANRFDNTGVSAGETLLDLPQLTPDAPPLSRVFASSGQRHWFKLAPQALKDSLIVLDTASSSGVATTA